MSWFLHVVHLTPEGKQWKRDEAFPDDGLIPLGTREEIHALIAKLFPDADFSDPLWISVRSEIYGMEILLDHDEPVKYLSLRHGGDEAARLIHEATGWDILDPEDNLMNFAVQN